MNSMISVVLLQISNFFSGLANAIVLITIPWLVLELTDSPAYAGVVVAISSLSALLVSPLGGLMINRFGKFGISIAADLLSTLSVMAFPVFVMFFSLTDFAILVIALIGALFDPLGYTARKTMITDVAETSNFNVDRLNGIHEGIIGISWIAGPAIGAWLIAFVGTTNSFWVAGVCFLVAALAIFLLKTSGQTPMMKEAVLSQQSDERVNLWLGFKVIWQDNLLRTIFISVLVVAAVYLPTESVVLPAYFESLHQPTALGFVISALASGSALTSFGYGWICKRISRRNLIRIALFGASICTLLMSLLPPLPLMLIAGFFLGLSWGPFNPLLNTLVQERTSPRVQAMVFSAQTSVFYAAPPLGMVIAGLTVEGLGIQLAYMILALVMVLTSMVSLLTKSLRHGF
jgi:MFS family permease